MKKTKPSGRIISLALAFCIFISVLSLGAFAADSGETVTVGATTDFGITEIGSDYQGIAIDYLSTISKYTGHKYSYVDGTPEELFGLLLEKKLDVIPCVTETEWEIYKELLAGTDDEPAAELTSFSLITKYSAVYTYDGSSGQSIDYADMEELNKSKIGYLAEDRSKYFGADGKFLCSELGDAEFILYNTEDQLHSDLISGKLDAVVKESIRVWENERIVYRFNMEESYFLVSGKDRELAAQLDDAVGKISIIDPQYPSAIYERNMFLYGAQKFAFSSEESKYISKHPEITVAYNVNADLIEFYDTRSNSLTGLTGNVLKSVEDFTGIKINVIPCDTLADCVKLLDSGEADAICGGVNSSSVSGYGNLYTTIPYSKVPIVAAGFVKTSLGDRMKIAVPDNSEDIIKYMKKLYPSATFLPYGDVKLCMEAVLDGEADVLCAGSYEVIYLKNGGYDEINIVDVYPAFHTDCIAVSSDETALSLIMEKAVSQISFNSSMVLSSDNMTSQGYETMTFNRFVDKYSWLIIAVSAVLLLCIVALIILVILRNNRETETDSLTGGLSKPKFLENCRKALKKSSPQKWAMVLFDIDKFKYVNDSLGFAEGNRMLERLYKTIGDHLDSDEIYARLSDDNFACMICNAPDNELTAKVNKIFSEFERRNSLFVKYPIIFSAGICRLEMCTDKNGSADIVAAIDRCTIAKKTLKSLHESSIAFYDGNIRDKALREKDYENAMPAALKNREFQCYLQPKYGTRSRHIEGAEALIRWNSKEFGFVYPNDFIPLSEKNGFVVELDFFMLEEVCKAMRRWLDDGKTPVVVSVNQSRLHIKYDDYIWRLREIVDKYNIPYKYIELELTESVFSENTELMLEIMNKLHEIGFKLSIDDFGSGYSSLNILKDIPADVVKIDREFFNGTVNSQKGRSVITTVVDLAKSLNMEVISEGVETSEQVEFLVGIDCAMVQGFYFAKPMTMSAFEELWENDLALMGAEQNEQEKNTNA